LAAALSALIDPQIRGQHRARAARGGAKPDPAAASPDLVHQEIWAYLLVQYAIGGLICPAATDADIDRDRISFVKPVNLIRRTATGTAAFPPEHWTAAAATRHWAMAEVGNQAAGRGRSRTAA
jgi:hypothetical protein